MTVDGLDIELATRKNARIASAQITPSRRAVRALDAADQGELLKSSAGGVTAFQI